MSGSFYAAPGPWLVPPGPTMLVCPTEAVQRPGAARTDPSRAIPRHSCEVLGITFNPIRWYLRAQRPAVLTLGGWKCLLTGGDTGKVPLVI